MANRPDQNQAERKIYFFQIVPEKPGDVDPSWRVDRAKLVAAIDALKGTPDFYFEESGERITCAEVHRAQAPQAVKFYAIRRNNLPSKDDGGGGITDLGLAEREGLAEAVHVRFFKNGIVGFESFFYGPRIGRVEAFLNEHCSEAFAGHRVEVAQLYRGDAIARALQFEDIRLLHLKLPPTITADEAKEAELEDILKTAENFHTSSYAELSLRTTAFDETFTKKVKSIFRRFKQTGRDPSDLLEALDISGVNPESGKVEPLDILSDALQRVALIPRESARTRALDSKAAFDAIKEAYDQVKDELPTDAIPA